MRIQFGEWIHSCNYCNFVSSPVYGYAIDASTTNGYYTIVFDTYEEAYAAYRQLLEKGYYDASNNQYSINK